MPGVNSKRGAGHLCCWGGFVARRGRITRSTCDLCCECTRAQQANPTRAVCTRCRHCQKSWSTDKAKGQMHHANRLSWVSCPSVDPATSLHHGGSGLPKAVPWLGSSGTRRARCNHTFYTHVENRGRRCSDEHQDEGQLLCWARVGKQATRAGPVHVASRSVGFS